MLSKNQIKLINSLKIKKFRQENQLFIAEGKKVVSELLNSNFRVKQVFALKSWMDENQGQLNTSIEVIEISAQELAKISTLTTPNEVLAVVEIHRSNFPDKEKIKDQLSIMLDDIKDPGNLGTIIRIADWFGVEYIFCSEESVDAFNPKVVQATMGSLSRVKIIYTDLAEFIKSLENKVPVYGAILGGENIYSQQLSKKGIIVLGNESKGVSQEVAKLVTKKLEIPRFGEAESLNVGIATAIICSEFRRN